MAQPFRRRLNPGAGCGIGHDLLKPGTQHRDGCFEMMRGIGRESHRLLEATLQALESRVQDLDEAGNLVAGWRNGQTLIETLRGDLRGGLANLFDRRDCFPRHPAPADHDKNEDGWNGGQHAEHDAVSDLIDLLQVRADPQRETIFGELANPDAAPGDLARMELLDSIARQRFPQAWREVKRVSSGIGHLNDTVAQRTR